MHRLALAVSMYDHKNTIGRSGQSPHGLFSLAKGEQDRFNVAFLDITTPKNYPHLIPLSHMYGAEGMQGGCQCDAQRAARAM